jgi:hypothetical protein
LHLKNTQVFFGKTADYLQTDAGKAFIGQSLSGGNGGEGND